jgi:hypothetical protein
MREPGVLVRFAGKPLIACLILVGVAGLAYEWYEGQLVWWLALAAVGVALRTLSAVGTLRRYNAWASEWEAMGNLGTSPASRTSHRWRNRVLLLVALIGIPVALTLPELQNFPALLDAMRWGWIALTLFWVFRVLRGLWQRAARRRTERKQARSAQSHDDPVSIAVGTVSDNPTRASAQRNLPDYCLRLLSRE